MSHFPPWTPLPGLALLVAWYLAALLINRPILPSPIKVGQTFVSELDNGLVDHFLASLWRVLASTALAIAVAAPAGLILGQSKKLNKILSPVIYLLYPVPKVVLLPVVLLFLGIGDLSTVTILLLM